MITECPLAHIRYVTSVEGVVKHSVDAAEADWPTARLLGLSGRKSPFIICYLAYLTWCISARQQHLPHFLNQVVTLGVIHGSGNRPTVLLVYDYLPGDVLLRHFHVAHWYHARGLLLLTDFLLHPTLHL